MINIFESKVSKGSRYNQIYIPKEKELLFEPGDIVEIKLIKKHLNLYYSKNLNKLSNFKEKLIREVFDKLSKYKEIEQIIFFGSFLTKKEDYNDIDLLILVKNENIEKTIIKELKNNFDLKLHVIVSEKNKFYNILSICPLTRSMVYYFVSNKKFEKLPEIKIDKAHLNFLLMFPKDLLQTNIIEMGQYYDALRRLVCIAHFLKRNEIAPDKINLEMEKLIKREVLDLIRINETIDKKNLDKVKEAIISKIKNIEQEIKNE